MFQQTPWEQRITEGVGTGAEFATAAAVLPGGKTTKSLIQRLSNGARFGAGKGGL